jgi:predicted nucleotidyltransferase
MSKNFDADQAKRFLEQRESLAKEEREQTRKAIFTLAVDSLKNLFMDSGVEVYLVGSITQPYMFNPRSDVDIVVKNFTGDRFALWSQLETMIKRSVEVIIFESCHFQEHVIKSGYKVL